jgi:leucyl/phenylalanyl-tRNA--protein transferase
MNHNVSDDLEPNETIPWELHQTAQETLQAYRSGAFPMAEDGELGYFKCNPRAVYTFDQFHIPKRLKRIWNKSPFTMKIDTEFITVVQHCREDRPEWISDELMEIYDILHRWGYAHSIEAWNGDQLVGGLYGMGIGAAFMAESMFHTETHASNCCLIYLMEQLQQGGFAFCDIQYPNDHTLKFKPESWDEELFNQRFSAATERQAQFK